MEHRVARRGRRGKAVGYQLLPPPLATSVFGVSKHRVCEIVGMHLVMWRWESGKDGKGAGSPTLTHLYQHP